jgi:hypothetical protein
MKNMLERRCTLSGSAPSGSIYHDDFWLVYRRLSKAGRKVRELESFDHLYVSWKQGISELHQVMHNSGERTGGAQ